jgi:hypothetical protein
MDAVTEISQLVLRERQGRDRGRWDQMLACFAPDSRVRLSWFDGSGPEFVEASRAMAERGDQALHRLGPPVVEMVGERALVEMSAVIEVRTNLGDVEVDLASAARLYYRVERRGGRWLVVALDPVYERDTLTPAHPGVALAVGPSDVAAHRPSYRFLTHVLTARGYPIAQDLHGDDRPAEVAAFVDAALAWLHA